MAIRVTQLYVEYLGDEAADSSLRVTKVHVQVLSKIQDINIAEDTLVLTEEAVPGFVESLEDAVANTDTSDASVDMAVFAVDTLTLTDIVFNQAVFAEDTLALTEILVLGWDSESDASDTLILTEDAVAGVASPLSAVDTLVLSDSSDRPAEAFDTITLTEVAELADVTEDFEAVSDSAGVILELGVAAVDTLFLVESLVRGSLVMPVGGEDPLETFEEIYDQAAVEFIQISTGLRDEAQGGGPTSGDVFDIIALTESTIGSWVLVSGGFSDAAVDTLTLTERADIAIPLAAEDTLVLTESAVGDAGPIAEDTITLSESAVSSVEQTTGLAAVDTLTLSESVGYTVDLVDLSCRYSPFVGTSTDPNAPTPPLTTYTAAGATPGFRLQFPETGVATDEIIIRDPSFGNIDRLHASRVNHESRGGTLIIFADPIWPKTENQIFSFSGLKLAKVDEIQTFMSSHLGLEIRLIDFEDRLWKGIIKEVRNPKVADSRGRFTISFEFEGILGSHELLPLPASAIGTIVDPTIIDPETPASAIGAAIDPTVILGSLILIPTEAIAIGAVAEPNVILSSLSLILVRASAIGKIVGPIVSDPQTPAIGIGTVVAPTVVLSSTTATPAEASAIGTVVAPTVVLGSLSFTLTEASAIGAIVAPTVLTGPVTVTPAEASAIGAIVAPTVVLGPTTATPAEASAIGTVVAPTVVLGSTTATPAEASAIGAVAGPTTVLGSLSLMSTEVSAIGAVVTPTVVLGSLSLTPAETTAIGTVVAPTVVLGSLSLTPSDTSAIGTVVAPTVLIETPTITPTEVSAIGAVVTPTVVLGSLSLTPAEITAIGAVVTPTVVLGSLSFMPAETTAIGAVVTPTVVLGSLSLTPAEATAIGTVVAPTVVLGSLSFTPSDTSGIGVTIDPTVVIAGGDSEPAAWIETFAINDIAASSATGNFDLVSDSSFSTQASFDLPGTPKAVMIMLVNGGDSFCLSFASGSGEEVFMTRTLEFNSDPMNATSEIDSSRLGRGEDGDATLYEFEFVEFLSNGVRINLTTNVSSGGIDFTVICFGGTSCEAKAIIHDLDGNAVDNTVDVTTVGFEPELVFSQAGNVNQTTESRQLHCDLNFGITHNDGGADPQPQFGFMWDCEDDTNAQQLRSYHRNSNQWALVCENNSGDNFVAAELLDFDASGFTVHCREEDTWGTTKVAALCLSWGGDADIHLQAIDSPTSNGTVGYTQPGFQPDWMFAAMNRSGPISDESVGNNDSLAAGCAFAWTSPNDGGPPGTDSIRGIMKILGDDNNGTGTLQIQTSVVSTTAPLDPTRTGSMSASMFFRADFDSFDTTGYTIDYVDAASAAKSLIILAIRDNT